MTRPYGDRRITGGWLKLWLGLSVMLVILAFLTPAMAAERRIALVIGNGAYAQAPLPNTINDARAMTETLGDLGFKVITRLNATQKEMYRAIYEFSGELEKGGVGLFYYAGHAVQIRGRNFMIPVGSRIKVEDHVEPESVDLSRVLGRMGGARNSLNIVILDACRDNPFGESFRYHSDGLAQTRAPANSFIAYAAAPGELAADGAGTNSYYTGALVKAIAEPGLQIEEAFKKVSTAVRGATKGLQIPWTSSSITQQFSFNPVAATAEKEPEGVGKAVDREVVFWQSIYTSTRPQYFEAYLAQFPDGIFAALAKEKLTELRGAEEKSKPASKEKPATAKQVATAAETGEGLKNAIDKAMAEAKSEGADYIEQVEAASTVLKERLRRGEEMKRQAEEAQKQVVKAATDKAEKQFQERLVKAEVDAKAAQQRLVGDIEKNAKTAQQKKIDDATSQAARTTKLALAKAEKEAAKRAKKALAAADRTAAESRRKELATANDKAAAEFRQTIARAEADAERMRQRMLTTAKKKADKTLQQKLIEAKRTAAKNERAMLAKLKKEAADKKNQEMKTAAQQYKTASDKMIEAARVRAAKEYDAEVASARQRGEKERLRIVAAAKKEAEAERQAQIAKLSPVLPSEPASDATATAKAGSQSSKPKKKRESVAKVSPKPKKPTGGDRLPSMQELGLGNDVSPALKRAIEKAMLGARKRGQGRQGQMLAALQAIKKHRKAGTAKPKAAPPSGKATASSAMVLGLANANPEFKEIIEITMKRAREDGKSFDDQVRAALHAVKLYRERETKSKEGTVTEGSQISELLLGDTNADPDLRRAIIFAVARARAKGQDLAGQMRAALAAIKAYRSGKPSN